MMHLYDICSQWRESWKLAIRIVSSLTSHFIRWLRTNIAILIKYDVSVHVSLHRACNALHNDKYKWKKCQPLEKSRLEKKSLFFICLPRKTLPMQDLRENECYSQAYLIACLQYIFQLNDVSVPSPPLLFVARNHRHFENTRHRTRHGLHIALTMMTTTNDVEVGCMKVNSGGSTQHSRA